MNLAWLWTSMPVCALTAPCPSDDEADTMCVVKCSGAAPCQCSPGGVYTAPPGRMTTSSPPPDRAYPIPPVTWSVCPTAWVCHAIRPALRLLGRGRDRRWSGRGERVPLAGLNPRPEFRAALDKRTGGKIGSTPAGATRNRGTAAGYEIERKRRAWFGTSVRKQHYACGECPSRTLPDTFGSYRATSAGKTPEISSTGVVRTQAAISSPTMADARRDSVCAIGDRRHRVVVPP